MKLYGTLLPLLQWEKNENLEVKYKMKKRQILEMAKRYEDPHVFIHELKKSYRVVPKKRGNFYFEAGKILYKSSYLTLALHVWRCALEEFTRNDNKSGELNCYGNIGNVYRELGDSHRALECYYKVIENLGSAKKTTKEKRFRLKCCMGIGNSYYNLGYFRKAIEYYSISLKIAERIGDRNRESNCHMNLGSVYNIIGDFQKAIDELRESLDIAEELKDESLKSEIFLNIGNSHHNLADVKEALKYYKKSLKIAHRIGKKSTEVACYNNIALANYNLRKLEKAIKYYRESLKLAREIKDEDAESRYYLNFANVYRDLGHNENAILCFKKSFEIAEKAKNNELKRIIEQNFGRIYFKSKPEIAYNHLKNSIELSEMITGNLVEEKHKIGFEDRTIYAYQSMIALCLNMNREKEAFEYLEKCKSRAFLEMIAATKIKPIYRSNELQSLLNDEEKYLLRLRQIQMQHLEPTRASAKPGEVEHIQENLAQIYNELEKYDPEYVYLRRGKPFSLDKILDMLASQKRDTTLIEYFVVKEKTFIFIIPARDNNLHVESVTLSIETLNKYVKDYHKGILNLKFQDMSDYLIEPISEYLVRGDLIYFVPYGLLHYFPLHALRLDGKPLIRDFPVAYAPNASSILYCQNKGSGKIRSCASFGVDPYRTIKESVEKEAEDVARFFNGISYTDSLATKSNVLKNCADKDVIHFACHGEFDVADPLSSRIVLYNKDVLTAREIFNMRLTTELVTLGACQTGINERSLGDELIGLTRAFLYAGAPSVVVSLWKVFSRSAYELMFEFYRQLRNGKDKATALQQAQITLMDERRYSQPHHWAPFILIGDWR